MIAIVMLAAWSDYLVGLWGYCLLRGYDVTIAELANPLHPYAGKWPPPQIGPGRVFPAGGTSASSPSTSSSGKSSPSSGKSGAQVAQQKISAATHGRF